MIAKSIMQNYKLLLLTSTVCVELLITKVYQNTEGNKI